MRAISSNQDTLTSYSVSYNSNDHLGVIFQRWGSIWPKVFPYCFVNVSIMIFLIVIKHIKDEAIPKLHISKQGMVFISTVVAYLLVSRVNTGMERFNRGREYLTIMYRELRELIQFVCVLSAGNTDRAAQEWRHEVAYRCLILLRSSMAVVDYATDHIPPWELPELNGVELQDVKDNLFVIESHDEMDTSVRRWQHNHHGEWEDSLRVPVRLEYLLKKSLHSQSQHLTNDPLPWIYEARLLSCVGSFMGGYYGIRKQIITPVPFPLIQMSRTFIFLYVFSAPFVLIEDTSSDVAHCFMVFVLTYGFIGLEICAIEMDDPFGDDENDFDNSAIARTAYEDTYMTILDVDGTEYADKLRKRMHDGSTIATGFTPPLRD